MSKSTTSSKGKAAMSEFSSGLDTGSLVTAKKRKMAPSVGDKRRGKRKSGKVKKK